MFDPFVNFMDALSNHSPTAWSVLGIIVGTGVGWMTRWVWWEEA